MSEQPLDLKRSMQIVRRHWIAVGLIALVGLIAGAAYTIHNPPLESSSALVQVPSSSTGTATQVVVAGSEDVLAGALRNIHPRISVLSLHKLIKVTSLAPGILSISAEGKTATQAERTANAVAASYIAYVSSNNAGLKAQAKMLAAATSATGQSRTASVITTALLGFAAAGVLGSVGALALSRGDKRLRQRDEIADAIGVPVLASVVAAHPANVARWSKLLEDYRPSAGDGWRLRSVLHHLGLANMTTAPAGGGRSVTVISLSSDKGALALGPQLAVYAASLGMPTVLLIGPQQDASPTATLRAACAGLAQSSSRRSLRITIADNSQLTRLSSTRLTVVVAVVDGRGPQLDTMLKTSASVLGVSAGAATADQLARVAANAAAAGREIEGILVADADATDPTTGRVPHIGRTVQRMKPTRLTSTTTEIGH
jgi:capsular polysaccharide biosynthesis protein